MEVSELRSKCDPKNPYRCDRLTSIAFVAVSLSCVPSPAFTQAAEVETALKGTNLTYFPRPSAVQCQADCATNQQCRASTWIRAGTYNASDPAMCYLLSAVTGRSPARGHISLLKATAPARPSGPITDPNELGPADFYSL